MLEDLLPIGIANLLGEAAALKMAGYRLVTLTCTAVDADHFDLLYHFDRKLELKHLRLEITMETIVPSISPVYFAAFLVENEIQDLFGIRFSGLAIDYERTLYGEDKTRVTPFCKYTVATSRPAEVLAEAESGAVFSREEV
ncbi:MAG: NADH-quinone oxidoreductase subunit C [Desulfobacterales bacterium]|jgi:ech hydrogenase subunit D